MREYNKFLPQDFVFRHKLRQFSGIFLEAAVLLTQTSVVFLKRLVIGDFRELPSLLLNPLLKIRVAFICLLATLQKLFVVALCVSQAIILDIELLLKLSAARAWCATIW